MKTKVLFQSKSGNTRKVAEAMAKAIGHSIEAVPPAYPPEGMNLLFIGAGVYGGKIDKQMDDFIRSLNSTRVKNVALFGTSGGSDKGISYMKEQLSGKGINVLEETFLCKGKYFLFFSRKHPTSQELTDAGEFAKRCVEKIKA